MLHYFNRLIRPPSQFTCLDFALSPRSIIMHHNLWEAIHLQWSVVDGLAGYLYHFTSYQAATEGTHDA
jgi:hypothetical protein